MLNQLNNVKHFFAFNQKSNSKNGVKIKTIFKTNKQNYNVINLVDDHLFTKSRAQLIAVYIHGGITMMMMMRKAC